ncbi:MAG TPA: prolyl oligopeptidase family serine peptidase, partial [Bacteroidales bacterium]|nr:prolyl oligopeptidase family serine peptidase [Bacteroidales bacterium]
VGPSNIFTLLESIPAYWEAGRAFLHGMVGDPNTEEGKKAIHDASPLFSADKINRPLLIIQGANDPRVKQAEADQIVIALRDKGKKVDYLLAPDEGHGFAKPLNRKAMYAEVEKFLSDVVGGRYQEDMEPQVRETLESLRVDVSTVKYEPKKEQKSASSLPVIQGAFKAGETAYDATFEIQGQKMPLQMTRSITQRNGNWVVNDEANGAMGQSKDEAEYTEAGAIVKRVMEQMGQKIAMSFDHEKATIEMAGMNMVIPFNGVYLTDAPGLDLIIARWPLKEGYSLITEVPDLGTIKPKQVKFSVTGKENVKEVACWTVEMVSTDNPKDMTTFWIDPVSGMALRMVSVMPGMGNAVMTIEKK